MDNNFVKIHEELSCFHLDLKAELIGLNGKFKELEKRMEEVWASIMKEVYAVVKVVKALQEKESPELRQDLDKVNQVLTKTKEEPNQERNKIVELEDYTRREKLEFNNIPESTWFVTCRLTPQIFVFMLSICFLQEDTALGLRPDKTENKLQINFCLLNAKYYIWLCGHKESKPKLDGFLRHFKHIGQIE